jgi:hypothetical protein
VCNAGIFSAAKQEGALLGQDDLLRDEDRDGVTLKLANASAPFSPRFEMFSIIDY